MVSTSLAVATVSPWLVPPYFLLMVWLLYPGRGERESASACPVESEPVEEPAIAERPEPSAAEIDSRSSAAPDLPVPALSDGSEAQQERSPEPATVKTKRGKGRGRKAKGAATLVEPPADATWIRVGPGKFVRADGPIPAESSLTTPATEPIAPTLSDDDVRTEPLPSFEPSVETSAPAERPSEVIVAPAEALPEVLTEPAESLSEAIAVSGESLSEASSEAVENLSEAISAPAEDLSEAFSEPVENLPEVITAPVEDLSEVESVSVENLPEVITAPVEDLSEVSSESIENLTEATTAPVEDLSEIDTEPVENLGEAISEPVEDLTEVDTEPVENLSEATTAPVLDEGEEQEEPCQDDQPSPVNDEALPLPAAEEAVVDTVDVDLSPTFESHHDDRSADEAVTGTWPAFDPGVGTFEDVGDTGFTADNLSTPLEAETLEIGEPDAATEDKDIASEAFEAAESLADDEGIADEEFEEDRHLSEVLPSPLSRSSFDTSPASWRGDWSQDTVAATWAPGEASAGRINRSGRQVRIAPGFRRHSKRSLGRFRQACRTFPPRSPPARRLFPRLRERRPAFGIGSASGVISASQFDLPQTPLLAFPSQNAHHESRTIRIRIENRSYVCSER